MQWSFSVMHGLIKRVALVSLMLDHYRFSLKLNSGQKKTKDCCTCQRTVIFLSNTPFRQHSQIQALPLQATLHLRHSPSYLNHSIRINMHLRCFFIEALQPQSVYQRCKVAGDSSLSTKLVQRCRSTVMGLEEVYNGLQVRLYLFQIQSKQVTSAKVLKQLQELASVQLMDPQSSSEALKTEAALQHKKCPELLWSSCSHSSLLILSLYRSLRLPITHGGQKY